MMAESVVATLGCMIDYLRKLYLCGWFLGMGHSGGSQLTRGQR